MVSEIKIKLVQRLAKEIQNYPIVGLVNMSNLPGAQLQKMRTLLKSKGIVIRMARKRLLLRALEESKRESIHALAEKVKGMPALIFSKDNPFTLNSIIRKNKSEATAKPGQICPKDIIVKAGPTSFAPGPIISELAAVGIKTKVENGKLSVIADAKIAKEGDVISQKVSDTLKRLDIKPMEIGLDLVAVWENGFVFDAKQLYIDEAEYSRNITAAAQWAFNLAVECAYPTNETVELLLQKAFREAKEVGMDSTFLTKDTTDAILARAEHQALALKTEGNIEAQVKPKEKEHREAASHPAPIKEQVEHKEPAKTESKESVHPSFGHVKEDQAKELFDVMQKGGTLRDVKVKVKDK